MGYTGASCLSPKQVAVANEIFGERKCEMEKAHYIIERFEVMAKKGVTGFTDERYGFIDEPIYKGAVSLLKGTR
jgi:citrate lyase subunit beta/citryl-CoA lyase